MAKFFNTTRSSLNATVDGTVLVFPSKAWTVVDDAVGTSASLQSLVEQKLLMFVPGNKPFAPAASSKPRGADKPVAPPKPAAPKKKVPPMAASAKPVVLKVDPPKADIKADAPKPEQPKPMTDAAAATTSKI